VFVPTAVGKEAGDATYFAYADGAYNTLSSERAEFLKREKHIKPTGTYAVPIKPLSMILSEKGVMHIDLLTIDVEGKDWEVLASHDWNILPKVIVIEDHDFDAENPSASRMVSFLVEKGYTLSAHTGPTLLFKRIHD